MKWRLARKRNLSTLNINICFRKPYLKILAWRVAQYERETWIINSLDKKRIETVEIWCQEEWRKKKHTHTKILLLAMKALFVCVVNVLYVNATNQKKYAPSCWSYASHMSYIK